jgi:hypothetical protein
MSRRIIPGEVLQQRVEVVGAVPASGGKKVGKDRARGEVMFISQNPQGVVIPKGSAVVANNGVRFTTDQEVTVPALSLGTARVNVTAVDPGPAGNVDARALARLEAPGVNNIFPRNDRPTTGGSDRDGKVVTAEDIAKLKEQLQSRALEQAKAELYARAGGERSLVSQSVKLRPDGEQFDPGPDSEADQVSGRFAVVASAVVFVNNEFNTMVQRTFLAQAGSGFDLPLSQLGVGTPEVLNIDDQARVRIRSRSQAGLVRQVNADELVDQLRWKTPADARNILSRVDGLSGAARIELSPEWAPRAYRVEVTVQAPK